MNGDKAAKPDTKKAQTKLNIAEDTPANTSTHIVKFLYLVAVKTISAPKPWMIAEMINLGPAGLPNKTCTKPAIASDINAAPGFRIIYAVMMDTINHIP